MKVILIKDCEKGKKDQIIDVSDGYATNYLIKNGFAIPFNKATKHAHDMHMQDLKQKREEFESRMTIIKTKIEGLILHFKLKVVNDKVIGSITRKQIMQALKDKGIVVDAHMVENKVVNTTGITNVKIELDKKIVAICKVRVENE